MNLLITLLLFLSAVLITKGAYTKKYSHSMGYMVSGVVLVLVAVVGVYLQGVIS
mgnify:CR=1 FL=1